MKMKNIKFLGVIFISMLILGSCTKDWEEMNIDPNSPTDVPAANILTYVERAMSNTFFDVWWTGNNTSSYANHISKIQYIDENRYAERDGIIARWNTLLTYVVELNKIIEKAQEQENPSMEAVAMILKAQIFHVMTDTWKAVPYSEAAQGETGILQPNYDTQEAVYQGILADLKTANTKLMEGGTITGDVLNGNDNMLWRKYANSLRMRIAIRFSSADAAAAKTVLSEILGNETTYPILSSNDDLIGFDWVGVSPYYEPWYSDKVSPRDDHGMCKTFIDALVATDDPRLSEFAHPAEVDGVYRGLAAGITEGEEGFELGTISRLGERYRDLPNGITYFMRYAEVEFIKAEAYIRADLLNNLALAEAAYEAGITASCAEHGVATGGINSYLADSNVAWDAVGSWGYSNQQKIAYQKWVSLFKQGHEAWAETRRTDIPQLSAASGSVFTGHNRPPFRWPYPTSEYTLNEAVVKTFDGNIEDRFWGEQMIWDKRTGVN